MDDRFSKLELPKIQSAEPVNIVSPNINFGLRVRLNETLTGDSFLNYIDSNLDHIRNLVQQFLFVHIISTQSDDVSKSTINEAKKVGQFSGDWYCGNLSTNETVVCDPLEMLILSSIMFGASKTTVCEPNALATWATEIHANMREVKNVSLDIFRHLCETRDQVSETFTTIKNKPLSAVIVGNGVAHDSIKHWKNGKKIVIAIPGHTHPQYELTILVTAKTKIGVKKIRKLAFRRDNHFINASSSSTKFWQDYLNITRERPMSTCIRN